MAYTQKDMQGSLFRNVDKQQETDRDYNGSITIEGNEYWLSAWLKTSKAGKKYLSISKPKMDGQPFRGSLKDDLSDEIQF